MTSKEYEYIIEQQKEIIKQQKDLIDKLLMEANNKIEIPIETADNNAKYTCSAPSTIRCDKNCAICGYHVMLC